MSEQFLKRDWETGVVAEAYNRPISVEGSYSAIVRVQVISDRMYISGNPAKFLTGQNVLGSDDMAEMCLRTYHVVLDKLQLPDCKYAHRAHLDGDILLTRVDCTYHYQVGTNDDVYSFCKAMQDACHVKYRGRGHFNDGMCSLMFGLSMKEGERPKGSRRSSFKFYNKYTELMVHPPKNCLIPLEKLKELCEGHVRAEACYRGMELKKFGLNRVSEWDENTCYELCRKWIDKMEMTETMSLKDDVEKELPRALHGTYRHWINGEDLRSMMSRPTFYRHRKQLMDHGVDISSSAHIKERKNDPVPLVRILEAKPVCEIERERLFWDLVEAA